MTFTTAHKGFILFSDDKPGNHATLFGPTGKKLAYRADMSVFEDDARRYSWGFEYDLPLVAGDRFVFATADREVVGEVRAGASMSTITVCSEPMVGRCPRCCRRSALPRRRTLFFKDKRRGRSLRVGSAACS